MYQFRDTMKGLRKCIDHLDDDLSKEESDARCQILIMCVQITKGLGVLLKEYPELLDPKA